MSTIKGPPDAVKRTVKERLRRIEGELTKGRDTLLRLTERVVEAEGEIAKLTEERDGWVAVLSVIDAMAVDGESKDV